MEHEELSKLPLLHKSLFFCWVVVIFIKFVKLHSEIQISLIYMHSWQNKNIDISFFILSTGGHINLSFNNNQIIQDIDIDIAEYKMMLLE